MGCGRGQCIVAVLFVSTLGLCVLGLFFSAVESDPASDAAALVALRSSVGGRWRWDTTAAAGPCSWRGVKCSPQGRVVELRLPGAALSGELPIGVIGSLTELRTLSLRRNALSGSIPSDLAGLSCLRNLYLQNNNFSGEIPGFLFDMWGLVRLNLAANGFSGEISPGFGNLTRLATLYLEGNRLNGSIPDLNLSLDRFNVSNNRLEGSIPSGLSRFPSSSFAGNSLCGEPLVSCNASAEKEKEKEKEKDKLSGGAIAGIGIVIGFLMLSICLCSRKKSDRISSSDVVEVEVEMPSGESGGGKELVFFGKGARGFELEDLLGASAEVLGKGKVTFGTAYKATLGNGATVAVKRFKNVAVTDEVFREKIEVVGNMGHENLVVLRAYYFSRDEKLLVYDYMLMGSLSALLHGAGRTSLNWEMRSEIALGAARGIAYIHAQGPSNSHGNIKSSNILLTTQYKARVSDFGLAHLATPNRVSGYCAPEVTDARKVSQKADVYSFGVLLLELLTGKAPSPAVSNEDGEDLLRWAQSVVREEWASEVFDLELLRHQDGEEEIVQLLQLAVDCTAQHPENRPSMTNVAMQIEEICASTTQRGQDTSHVQTS